ncbi:outer membrane homotrimeric porin [Bilophila wadsworthia]|uniref:Outer membrane homotrimeric porin n=6 Tax=Bilophila wadsworthia TaxID=35833 RepID=E5Y2Q9_BILW3|nr:outer membrane homotrimeric porin [Bilophila wadsworthia]EFV45728.1 hypothetical protein HMPREF0179_00502 [Bilophila wadsworthia 3_1_6]
MKRLMTLLLAAGLVLGATSAAKAVDFKMTGLWQNRVSFADRNFEKHNGDDKMRAATRLRTQIDVIASESLKGVMFFEIGHQNWGKAAEGAALGTDGKEIKVRYSYVDWIIPQTDAKVRMGLQPYVQPTFTGIGSPILDADGAGITISNQFTENVSASLFWLRAENDNDPEMTKHDAHDAMDFIGVTVPMTFDGVKVTPWGMGGIIGHDSFKGGNFDLNYPMAQGMLPLMGTSTIVANSDKDHGSAWFGGVSADLSYFDPFRFALDAAYGSVDLGTSKLNGKNFDVKRSGWYAALLAEYKLESCTPGLLFWYSSGDDANAYNGSERLPSIDPDVYVTSYGFDGTNYGGAAQTMGYGISGTWAVMARVKDISFMEDLSHVLRVVYYQGTNNKEMVRQGMISNPQHSQYSMMYLTTGDKAVEVNFDTEYKLYKNLSLFVELGYIRLDLDKDLWKGVGYEAKENNFKGTFSVGYKF